MPISHPFVYAIYLAKLLRPYATLGLAEDTWALNERRDRRGGLPEAGLELIFEERKKQLWDVLEKTKKRLRDRGVRHDDRISHMFYRYLDPDHPANEGKDTERAQGRHPRAVRQDGRLPGRGSGEDRGRRGHGADGHLGPRLHELPRGVNLNSWLRDEGYLV